MPFADEWPKIVASGIAIPILQFCINRLWQIGRKARTASIRKEIVDLQAFRGQLDSLSDIEQAPESKALVKQDLVNLFEKLKLSSKPFTEAHPGVKTTLNLLLLYTPPYPIGWIIRLVFFVQVVACCYFIFALTGDLDDLESPAVILLIISPLPAILINLWARAADRVKGRIVNRKWWRRLLLFYKPNSKTAALFQVIFWLALILNVALAQLRPHRRAVLGLLTSIPGLSLLWWSAVHFDRKGANKAN